MGLGERALDADRERREALQAQNKPIRDREDELTREALRKELWIWCHELGIADVPSCTIVNRHYSFDGESYVYVNFEVDGIAFEGRLHRTPRLYSTNPDPFQVSLVGGPRIKSLEDLGSGLRLKSEDLNRGS